MADAKEILGLPKGTVHGVDKRPKPLKETPKKPDGVSREVYALTGGLPLVMPALDISNLKKRPASDSDKISWQWLPFTSSARRDNLELYHWVKVVNGVRPTGDYAFAKYNKTVDVVQYTDEEYAKYLTDPNWTRHETDQLFDLCRQFDLRFIIIADRFTPSRSVEELKNRYYSAARAILLAKAPSPEEVADHPLVKDHYNIIHEVERKRALATMLSQSRQQEREDAELLAEAKRITESRQNAKNVEETELPTTVPVPAPTNVEVEKIPAPAGSTSPSPIPQPNVPVSVPQTPSTAGISIPSGPKLRALLRTTILGQLTQATTSSSGARMGKRIDQTLQDLGVNVKPKVPTKLVCMEHLELRKEILAFLSLQKQVQWKESELSMLRENPYADFPPTPSTPKRSHRGGDHERAPVRALGGSDVDGFTGERIGKRDHKRKAPARFLDVPPSPPQGKRARKLKAPDS